MKSLDVAASRSSSRSVSRSSRFDVDIFNVLNSGTVLGRIYDVSSSKFNDVAEIMNPRIARFGLRFQF